MMKRIEVLDKAAEVGTKYCDINVNPTFGAAYFYSQEAGNDLINFGEVIWDYDIDEILENCRRFGITEFTISSTFSSLIITIAEFESNFGSSASTLKLKIIHKRLKQNVI